MSWRSVATLRTSIGRAVRAGHLSGSDPRSSRASRQSTVSQIELEDDWKGITLLRIVAIGDPLHASVLAATADLQVLIHAAEVALSGLPWKDEYATKEDAFCRQLLHPLIRRMGFVSVRYTHGKREYGKDFTFSELTPFGYFRHYGLQAKAGDVSGGVNAAIDELLGQIADAFSMPFYELDQKTRDIYSRSSLRSAVGSPRTPARKSSKRCRKG